MSIEELLRPRVMCMGNNGAHYPGSPWHAGDILRNDMRGYYCQMGRADVRVGFITVAKHRHLFREMKWWELRCVEDMPEWFVDRNGKVIRAIAIGEWRGGNTMVHWRQDVDTKRYKKGCVRCTRLNMLLPWSSEEASKVVGSVYS